MATKEQLIAQRSVLRMLAPDLCVLMDKAIEDVCNAESPVNGQNFCPCGEVIWDDDWNDAQHRDIIDDAARHECSWTRACRAWDTVT